MVVDSGQELKISGGNLGSGWDSDFRETPDRTGGWIFSWGGGRVRLSQFCAAKPTVVDQSTSVQVRKGRKGWLDVRESWYWRMGRSSLVRRLVLRVRLTVRSVSTPV